jgi:hypothetical protein
MGVVMVGVLWFAHEDWTGTGAVSNPFGGRKEHGDFGAGRRNVAERAIRSMANDAGIMKN